MKTVKSIPEPEVHVQRDPWLDKVLDGTLRLLGEPDWSGRYKSTRSAASAIHQAAQKRGMKATVAIRGTDLYVQGQPPESNNGKKPRQATAQQARARKALENTPERAAKIAANVAQVKKARTAKKNPPAQVA